MKFSFARPWWVVLGFLALGVVSTLLASRLTFRGSFVELLPASAPEVQDLNLVAQKAGGEGYLVIRARGAPTETLRRFADAVAPRLEQLPDVRYVEYRYNLAFFKSRGLWLLSATQLRGLRQDLAARIQYEKKRANPFFVNLTGDQAPPDLEAIERKYAAEVPRSEYLGSADGRELYLFIKPNGLAGDLDFARRLIGSATGVLEDTARGFPGVQIDSTGSFRMRLEEDAVMKKDLSFASILSTLMAVLLILLATRRASALLVVGAPVAIGIAVTFAVAQATVGHLNVVTGFLVAILIGLGIEYGVHLAMRYWEERALLPAEQAMEEALSGTFFGAATSALTNAAAFLVLLFARFQAFAQFGFIAGVGVLLTVLVAYALGPAILALAERVRPIRLLPPEKAEAFRARRFLRWPTLLISLIALCVLAFAGYSLYVARSLTFESDMRKLKGSSPASALDDHITEQLGVKITPAILLVDTLQDAARVGQLVQESRRKHGDASAFQKAASMEDLLPEDIPNRQRELLALKDLLLTLPRQVRKGQAGERLRSFEAMLDARPYGPEEVPLELRRRFEALDHKGTFVLLFPRYSNYDTREIQAWAEQISELKAQAGKEGIQLHALDGNLIAARIFALVKGDGPYILWSAALVVFLAIWISLRSLKKTLMVAGPLFVGMVCLAGGMHIFNVHLNFINAVVLPNLLAIAVDNSVHLYHRYEEEGPGSLGHILRHTGLAAVVATLSNASGYGALLTASHQGLRSIGQLAVLGVACTFLGTTVLFPALLALFERFRAPRPPGLPVPSPDAGNR